MILPKDIQGEHRIRDAFICTLYAREALPIKQIASRVKLSTSQIQRVLYKNRGAIKIDKNYEDIKLLSHLKRLLAVHPNLMAKKSTLDIIDKIQDIVHGKEKAVSQTMIVNIPLVQVNGQPKEYAFGQTNRISELPADA